MFVPPGRATIAAMPEGAERKNSERREIASLHKGQDTILSVQRETLKSLDLTSMLMVAATVLMAIVTTFSAWTSWRVAHLTQEFYSTPNRPYLGVASMRLDRSDPDRPTAWVEFRNFGNMPAEEGVIDVASAINGNIVADPMGKRHVVLSLGVLSPDAPYFFGAMFPAQFLKPVLSGSAKLVVMIEATYKRFGLAAALLPDALRVRVVPRQVRS